MCGRFTLTAEAKELAKRFGVEISASFYKTVAPRYNIAPTQPVVVLADDGQRRLMQMRWGLIPSWAKDPAIGNRMINARAETLTTNPALRVANRKRRCSIVADGFYEWKKTGGAKQPMRIVLKNREPFGFAGLRETWKPPEGEEIKTCIIITTDANELLKDIHDRMPVILPREKENHWLDPDARPLPNKSSSRLIGYAVGTQAAPTALTADVHHNPFGKNKVGDAPTALLSLQAEASRCSRAARG